MKLRKIVLILLTLFLLTGCFEIIDDLLNDFNSNNGKIVENKDKDKTTQTKPSEPTKTETPTIKDTGATKTEQFENDGKLLDSRPVLKGTHIITEADAYEYFAEIGMDTEVVMYEYDILGNFLKSCRAERDSLHIRPYYFTYYTTKEAVMWLVILMDGHFYATLYWLPVPDWKGGLFGLTDAGYIITYSPEDNHYYYSVPHSTHYRKVSKLNTNKMDEYDIDTLTRIFN